MNHVADSFPTVFSVFSGVGWMDCAARVVFPRMATAGFAEWDAYAASVLLARMEDAGMECAPVWNGSLQDLDGRPFHGVVDMLCGGPPCQPYSTAGRQQGNTDRRSFAGRSGIPAPGEEAGPLGHLLRLVHEMRPAVVWFENVPPWVRAGHFREFGEELCGLGYEILGPVFCAAADVGASHRRERVFIMAYDPGQRSECRRLAAVARWRAESDAERSGAAGMADSVGHEGWRVNAGGLQREPDGGGKELANAEDAAAGRLSSGTNEANTRPCKSGGAMEHAAGPQVAPCPGGDGQAVARSIGSQGQHGRGPEGWAAFGSGRVFAPGPQSKYWRTIVAHSPHLAPAVEPGLRVLVDGRAYLVDESRSDQLRCSGNGVVALHAAIALRVLLQRLERILK